MGKALLFSNLSLRIVLGSKMYLATLADLPTIIEGQKTLDFKTFYKSVDVSQILYVHPKFLDDITQKQPRDLIEFGK